MCRDFVTSMVPKTAAFEIQGLFSHFDQRNQGFILKEEFVAAFGRAVSEKPFSINIEDLIKPISHHIKTKGTNISVLFQKADANNNGRLSAQEVA